MRLINADAMLERNKNSIYDTTDLEEMLKYEPTAYDVDKVVEKPEVCRWAKGLYSFETCGSDVSVKDYKKYAMAFCPKCGKRIEIVKGGGVDE